MQSIYFRLLGFLRPYRLPLMVAMVCMVVLAACTAALAWLLKPALDNALGGKDMEFVYMIPMLIIGLYVIKGAAYYGQAYLMGYIGQKVVYDLRNLLYGHLIGQSLNFFAHRKTGELLAHMSYDVTLVQSTVSTAVTALMRDSATIVFLTFVIFYQDWLLAVIAILVFPVVVLPIVRFGRKMRRASTDGQISMGALSSLIEETVGGIRIVKAFGMEKYEKERFSKLTNDFFQHQMRAFRIHALSFPIMELLAGCGIAGVLFYGGIRIAAGETTPGTLMSFLAALIMLYEPVKRLSRANNEIQQGLAAAKRVFGVLDEKPKIVDSPNAIVLERFSRSIDFRNVRVRYEGSDRDVLRNIHLQIRAGEVVALVGRSGAGKTTLVNLVPRFIDVTEGAVLLDGHDVREITQESLRRNIAVVTQEVILFNDTVRNNLAYGQSELDMEKIELAARAANAHDFIMELPQGYDTLIGERGAILSGGQRQRLSLARALLKDAPILILDEATSSLDLESERLVQQAIDRLMKGRTVLVIAHRLSTIRHADRIVVLDKGEIEAMGSHDDLLAHDGLYAELYHMQFERHEKGQEKTRP
jgi:subfamily B ATP-binding cassette protein MsbA